MKAITVRLSDELHAEVVAAVGSRGISPLVVKLLTSMVKGESIDVDEKSIDVDRKQTEEPIDVDKKGSVAIDVDERRAAFRAALEGAEAIRARHRMKLVSAPRAEESVMGCAECGTERVLAQVGEKMGWVCPRCHP